MTFQPASLCFWTEPSSRARCLSSPLAAPLFARWAEPTSNLTAASLPSLGLGRRPIGRAAASKKTRTASNLAPQFCSLGVTRRPAGGSRSRSAAATWIFSVAASLSTPKQDSVAKQHAYVCMWHVSWPCGCTDGRAVLASISTGCGSQASRECLLTRHCDGLMAVGSPERSGPETGQQHVPSPLPHMPLDRRRCRSRRRRCRTIEWMEESYCSQLQSLMNNPSVLCTMPGQGAGASAIRRGKAAAAG